LNIDRLYIDAGVNRKVEHGRGPGGIDDAIGDLTLDRQDLKIGGRLVTTKGILALARAP